MWFIKKTYSFLWGVALLLSGATHALIANTTHASSTMKADQMATAPPATHVQVTSTPHITMTTTSVITHTSVQLLHTPEGPESKAGASEQLSPSGSTTGTVWVQSRPATTSTALAPPETPSIALKTTAEMGPTISPTSTSPPPVRSAAGTTAGTTTGPTAGPTTRHTTGHIAGPTAESPTGPSTEPTTGPSTEPTTEPSTEPTTEPSTEPTTGPTFELLSTATPHHFPEVFSLVPEPNSNSSTAVHATTGPSSFATATSDTPPPLTQMRISTTSPDASTSAFPTTTKFHVPAKLSSTKASTSSTTASKNSESPRKHPFPTSKSITSVTKTTETPPTALVQTCPVRRIIKQCLIAIAALALVATIFMVSTIVLCTKLSAKKYRVKKPQPATEMMCISALLPERNRNYTRQRGPVSNGVLVFPSGADSDDEAGDNVTLSSFLPENDRFV